MAAGLTISPEDPRAADGRALVAALDAHLGALYAPEQNHLVDVDTMASQGALFLVARKAGAAVGCVALRIDGEGYGELKRLYVAPEARGTGVGRLLVTAIEEAARDRGLTVLRVETGISQAEAIGLLRGAGYKQGESFAGYPDNGYSLFMEKTLA